MNEEEVKAYNLITNVCKVYNGNLEDHKAIQGSLAVIKKSMEKTPKNIKNENKKEKKKEEKRKLKAVK